MQAVLQAAGVKEFNDTIDHLLAMVRERLKVLRVDRAIP